MIQCGVCLKVAPSMWSPEWNGIRVCPECNGSVNFPVEQEADFKAKFAYTLGVMEKRASHHAVLVKKANARGHHGVISNKA
jgi:hypothetical protein